MAMTFTPPFVQVPIVAEGSLVAPTAVTARTNITGTTGLLQLSNTSTNGLRVDSISVKGAGTTAAGLIFVWLYNGTTSYLIDEIICSAVTPSTTVAGDYNAKLYQNFTLPPTYQLFVSSTISQNYNVTLYGGAY